DRVAALIRFYQPDLLGVQEAQKGQMDDLQALLPEYASIGVGTNDGKERGEYVAIFYRRERLQLLDQNTFWLSKKPDKPGSKGWDAALSRSVTWGKFQDLRTGKPIYCFNTHFDHIGMVAREQSAQLLVARASRIAGKAPVVVMGDFNCNEKMPSYQLLVTLNNGMLQDTREVAILGHHGPEGSLSGFRVTGRIGPRIDHIFIDRRSLAIRHAIIPDSQNERYPSDHLPVLADILPEPS
ncbi:MAG TPA: endonuclease/exonuclease/phosphatase family protein, partial [Armatimonadota bacterium]|nr:endonuclease/exonuclease/phosphatase family protein [Armatimonadota bacterium]